MLIKNIELWANYKLSENGGRCVYSSCQEVGIKDGSAAKRRTKVRVDLFLAATFTKVADSSQVTFSYRPLNLSQPTLQSLNNTRIA